MHDPFPTPFTDEVLDNVGGHEVYSFTDGFSGYHQINIQEEDLFLAGFHQQVQKAREKSWHDRHIKNKIFKVGDLVLLYDSKFVKFLGKFCMHWLGHYQVKQVTSGGAVELAKLNGEIFPTLVIGSMLKLYRDIPPSNLA